VCYWLGLSGGSGLHSPGQVAAVDFQNSTKHRVFVLTMIPAIVLMAIMLPNAFTDQALWFAVSYLVVQVWITVLQGLDAWKTQATRKTWLSYGPIALIAPVVLVIGSLFEGNTRIIIWIGAVVINIVAALSAAKGSKEKNSGRIWSINASHFTERHSLFLIIVLGEIIVAIGLKSNALSEKYGMSFELAGSAALAISVACMYWWSYFAYIPKVTEHKLKTAEPHLKGRYARDIFSFGLFLLVVSIIFFAVVGKHFLEHPADPLVTNDLVLLGISGCGFLGAVMFSQFYIARHFSIERSIGIIALATICFSGQFIPAWVTILLFSLTLLIVAYVIWGNFKKTEIYKEIWDS
jgi:low temperature requirement protein LtrA